LAALLVVRWVAVALAVNLFGISGKLLGAWGGFGRGRGVSFGGVGF